MVYSTNHSRSGDRRWRIINPLAEPLGFEDWQDAQVTLFDHREGRGVEVARMLARAAQLVVLPNVPDVHDKKGTPLRGDDGEPLYYDHDQSPLTAPGTDLDHPVLAVGMASRRAARAEEEASGEAARLTAIEWRRQREERRASGGLTVIEHFNATHTIGDSLTECG